MRMQRILFIAIVSCSGACDYHESRRGGTGGTGLPVLSGELMFPFVGYPTANQRSPASRVERDILSNLNHRVPTSIPHSATRSSCEEKHCEGNGRTRFKLRLANPGCRTRGERLKCKQRSLAVQHWQAHKCPGFSLYNLHLRFR